VPNLPTARARLRLRLGREHAEIETAPTASFRIVGAPGAPPPGPIFHEGTLWTGLVPPGSGAGLAAFAPAARLMASDPEGAAAEAPPRWALGPPAQDLAATEPVEPRSGLTPPPMRPGGGPEFFPQRN
jgi:hypothetical protein